MELEELEDKIDDLENAYSAIEDAINSYPECSEESPNLVVLEQILDGLQYFINKFNWEKDKLEADLDKEWDK